MTRVREALQFRILKLETDGSSCFLVDEAGNAATSEEVLVDAEDVRGALWNPKQPGAGIFLFTGNDKVFRLRLMTEAAGSEATFFHRRPFRDEKGFDKSPYKLPPGGKGLLVGENGLPAKDLKPADLEALEGDAREEGVLVIKLPARKVLFQQLIGLDLLACVESLGAKLDAMGLTLEELLKRGSLQPDAREALLRERKRILGEPRLERRMRGAEPDEMKGTFSELRPRPFLPEEGAPNPRLSRPFRIWDGFVEGEMEATAEAETGGREGDPEVEGGVRLSKLDPAVAAVEGIAAGLSEARVPPLGAASGKDTYGGIVRETFRSHFGGRRSLELPLSVDELGDDWFGGFKAVLVGRLGLPRPEAEAVHRWLHFGRGPTMAAAVLSALDFAAAVHHSRIETQMEDSAWKGPAAKTGLDEPPKPPPWQPPSQGNRPWEVVATGAFDFATEHARFDLHLVPIERRVQAFLGQIPQTAKARLARDGGGGGGEPIGFTVDAYVSPSGGAELNQKIAAARLRKTRSAVLRALQESYPGRKVECLAERAHAGADEKPEPDSLRFLPQVTYAGEDKPTKGDRLLKLVPANPDNEWRRRVAVVRLFALAIRRPEKPRSYEGQRIREVMRATCGMPLRYAEVILADRGPGGFAVLLLAIPGAKIKVK